MRTWLEEKIGNPDLFTGRKKDLAYFLRWTERTKRKISKSTAILSRRKTGKTALLQRLFNILFEKDDGVIPFYFEIRESDQWIGNLAREFFLTFAYQYMAFKTRKVEYLHCSKESYSQAREIAHREKMDYLARFISDVESADRNITADSLWNMVIDIPRLIAHYRDERIVQMIDEFQFLNRFIFRDKACTQRIGNLAGCYLGTAEYKSAPLLVAGSWVGWLVRDLLRMLPGRFQFHYLENIPRDEAIEMILKYSHLEDIPVSEETAPMIAEITEGNPFYIGSLFRSKCSEMDLSTEKGVIKALGFETLDRMGEIRGTWMEYASYAMSESNDIHAKRIVLYLSKHRNREVTRRELGEQLGLTMTDSELEKKLKILVKADIIEQGRGNFFYRGVPDNIFDKVFRGVYADEIEAFDPKVVTDEYERLARDFRKRNRKLRGEYGHYKGKFTEYLIIDNLRYRAHRDQSRFGEMMENLPDDFRFAEYRTVWSYSASPLHQRDIQIDIFAKAEKGEYSLIGEVKNRRAKFSVKEAEAFRRKAGELMRLEHADKALLFVFSVSGFFRNTLAYLEQHGIAWTSDKRWLEK